MKLLLELNTFEGETFDNTINLSDESLKVVESEIKHFVDRYFDEGYGYCDKRYFDVSEKDYEVLKTGAVRNFNSVLNVSMYEG